MENILDELWASYLEEKDPISTEEEIKHLLAVEKSEQALRKALNEEQLAILEEYISRCEDLNRIYSANCFKIGVRFATKYTLEATK